MLYMFHAYVVSVLSKCCVCFTIVFKWFSCVFLSVSDVCIKYFIRLQTYVAIVASKCFKSRTGVASHFLLSVVSPRCLLLLPAPVGHPWPLPLFLDGGDVQSGTNPTWARETVRETAAGAGVRTPHPSGRLMLASPFELLVNYTHLDLPLSMKL
jgi:hypothetical protein